MRRTALFEEHLHLGARMVDFAGWEMPVQYAGVIEEHRAVRASAEAIAGAPKVEAFAIDCPCPTRTTQRTTCRCFNGHSS